MSDPAAPVDGRLETQASAPRSAGRYTLHAQIASGGMATVHYGQMLGAHGFSRVVAIKRMLPRLARDPAFHSMFVEEARLASRVQHPNVVPILDVVDEHGEVMIVMEYVRGPSLSTLLHASAAAELKIPIAVVASVGCAMLAGLHAAHEARDRRGRTLGIVHRDVSPQNVLIGLDGVTRIMDFGIAKAQNRVGASQEGQLKGKLSYMAPEQFQGAGVDRRTDVFATGVVLWGMLAGRRLFRGSDVTETMDEVLRCEVPPLAGFRADVPDALERALRSALDADKENRPATAEALAAAIEAAAPVASVRAVAEWAQSLVHSNFAERDAIIVEIEKTSTGGKLSREETTEPEGPRRSATAEVTASRAVTTDWTPQPDRGDATVVEGAVRRASEIAPAEIAGTHPRRSRVVVPLAIVTLAAAVASAVALGRIGPAKPPASTTSSGAETESAVAVPTVVLATSSAMATPSTSLTMSVTQSAPDVSMSAPAALSVARPRETHPRDMISPRPAKPVAPDQPKTAQPGARGPYYPPAAFPK